MKSHISVKGRLFSSLKFWKDNLKAPKFVLNIISQGYSLPLLTLPPPFFAKNNRSSLDIRKFVETEIDNYLKKGYIHEIKNISYCCNPLTVAGERKPRLVLDLRHVNNFLNVTSFKYEDLKVVSDLLDKNDYFTSYDLISGYFHIDINPHHFKYLGFQWTFSDGKTKNYQFSVLVFGLASACYVFTKVTKPLVKHWRLLGMRIAVYLDDGFNIASSYRLSQEKTSIMVNDLSRAGFLINYKKSNLVPSQIGEWVGTTINSVNMSYAVPTRKVESLKHNLLSVMSKTAKVSARILSNITGRISSMHLPLGPITRLMTRSIYADIGNQPHWDSLFQPSKECRSELTFWLINIDETNGYAIKPCPTTSQILFTDASEHSYGGYVLKRLGKIECHGRFESHERGESSTKRELLAIKYCVQSFAEKIRHEAINIRTDNQGAARILEIGSPKPHLQDIALDIFGLCIKNDIRLHPTWIPRELNKHADYISKLVDTDDWSIDIATYKAITKVFGYPDVDRFADNLNKKVEVFNSKFFCPGSSAVDCFTEDWSHSPAPDNKTQFPVLFFILVTRPPF